MNIFIAGIHGVGKSYLASRTATGVGMVHTSASTLIKEERSLCTWSNDKQVSDVEANQIALANAIRRHNASGTRLLLDGHFVLLGNNNEMIRLGASVFDSLNLSGVILIEAEPETVAQRLMERDQRHVDLDFLKSFMFTEREQAKMVCTTIKIPLIELLSASLDEFAPAIDKLSYNSKSITSSHE